jgi:site-specific recombinase XerD
MHIEQPRLLDRVREAIWLRHYSLRTAQSYIQWIRRFILFHNKRHPETMGEPEVSAFLSHLAVNRKISASTQNQALSAIMFCIRTYWSISWTGSRMLFVRNDHVVFRSF